MYVFLKKRDCQHFTKLHQNVRLMRSFPKRKSVTRVYKIDLNNLIFLQEYDCAISVQTLAKICERIEKNQ